MGGFALSSLFSLLCLRCMLPPPERVPALRQKGVGSARHQWRKCLGGWTVHRELACGGQAFIATSLFDPSKYIRGTGEMKSLPRVRAIAWATHLVAGTLVELSLSGDGETTML